ncbi:hypothetical protein QBC34DRAFT_407315 [Podospora aff. communis PSN243]|uniref:Uncharacterized protein n=1 Tax=Podospora aff. communis PSN243 TaxID=3040156 RepID=A0AAV9GLR4_9PEZI|nr:hypothetical protein QBC34DRAFT_407315 [Podospora aff. communis PSN243]
MDTHAVCLVDEIPIGVVDRLLAAAYARSEELAPGSPQDLAVVGMENGEPSRFLGMTPKMVSQQLGPENTLFLILDARSAEDDTALLVARGNHYDIDKEDSNDVETLRIDFSETQCTITTLEVGCGGFPELQSIAGAGEGVLRRSEPKQKGGPAPRKLLRRGSDGEE